MGSVKVDTEKAQSADHALAGTSPVPAVNKAQVQSPQAPSETSSKVEVLDANMGGQNHNSDKINSKPLDGRDKGKIELQDTKTNAVTKRGRGAAAQIYKPARQVNAK